MTIYREANSNELERTSYNPKEFRYEVQQAGDTLYLHEYFINNRNRIFDKYLYLLHETTLSEESSIDFIAFTEEGAILLIELKRKGDSRNRQEVISQIVKYALDSFAINNLIEDEDTLRDNLRNPDFKNKEIDLKTITRIKNNIQQNSLNLYLVTEKATDEVLAASYYLSYGRRNQKITVVELNRFELNQELYCSVRFYNKQPLLNSSRKAKEDIETKLTRIEDPFLRQEVEKQIKKWYKRGWAIEPLTVSTPQYFTFLVKPGKSLWAHYYVQDSNQRNLDGKIRKNSVVLHVDIGNEVQYENLISWFKQHETYYIVKSKNKGKTKDYCRYCIDISDYDSAEIDAVFDKLHELALNNK